MREHRDAPHLAVSHLGHDLVERLVLVAPAHLAAHDLVHVRFLRPLAERTAAQRQVAVRDHADQALAVNHRQRAHVLVAHQLGRALDALARHDRAGIARHDVGYFLHRFLLSSSAPHKRAWGAFQSD